MQGGGGEGRGAGGWGGKERGVFSHSRPPVKAAAERVAPWSVYEKYLHPILKPFAKITKQISSLL